MNKHRRGEKYKIGKQVQCALEIPTTEFDDELELEQQPLEPNLDQDPTNDNIQEPKIIEDPTANSAGTPDRISQLHSTLVDMESLFCLKLCSNFHLSQEVIDNVFEYVENIHKTKVEIISETLHDLYGQENSVEVKKVTNTIGLIDANSGVKEHLRTAYRRDQYLKSRYNFIEPQPTLIGYSGNIPYTYYRLPIRETLQRLLSDNSLREEIIHEPLFSSKIV